MREIFEGVKRFGIVIVVLALLAYGSWVYNNIYGVGITVALILIAVAIAFREMSTNKQRVLTIKHPLK
ncbi:MAG TPA: hypothetical protein VNF06_03160 [Candidatus Aquilonibacter sp.]|nr:hypothetical protein [Candidatus Aquilonibacter sp.]